MPFTIVRGDINRVSADAVVDAAAPDPLIGSESRHVTYSEGDGIAARYVIHAARPAWQGGDHEELETLAACYRESLLLANSLGCRSIAFPMLSSGISGFPRDEAVRAALVEIADFLMLSEMSVMLAVPENAELALPGDMKERVGRFLDENYIEERLLMADVADKMSAPWEYRSFSYGSASRKDDTADFTEPLGRIDEEAEEMSEEEFDQYFDSLYEESRGRAAAPMPAPSYSGKAILDDVMASLGQTFQEKLLDLIDDKGFTDTQVYKRANMDRKLFSKIRCNQNYKPSKATALALAVALELNLDETTDLLKRAGLALSPSSKSDLIIKYCIMNGIYDIFDVNALLFEYDQQLLGA